MDLVKKGAGSATVTVHLGGEPAVVAARLLIQKIQDSCGVKLELKEAVGYDDITRCLQISVSTAAIADLPEMDVTTPDLQGRGPFPEEGFVADLAHIGNGLGLVLSAVTLGSLVCAIGELLRGIEFSPNRARVVRLPAKIFQPTLPIRGVYLSMTPGSEFFSWSESELQELFEDWALWGINTVMTRYNMYPLRSDFRSDSSGMGNQILKRHQIIARIAHRLGMKTGLVTVTNSDYLDRAKVSLRSLDSDTDPRRGGGPTLLCPSTHEGRSFLLQDQEELFREILPVDVLWLWPFDSGGCWCERCDPWVKTFLGLSQEIARSVKRYHTDAKAYISTRWFNSSEFDILDEYLSGPPDWLDGVVLDESLPGGKRRSISEMKRQSNRFAKKRSVIYCPDISLNPFETNGADCYERGRLGAGPRITADHQQYAQLSGYLSGVVVQSDSVADDLTKVAYSQWAWSPQETPETAVKKYWRYHFDADEETGWELVQNLEENSTHSNIKALEREKKSLAAAQRKLAPENRETWRWRLFVSRVELDELVAEIEPSDGVIASAASALKKAGRAKSRAAITREVNQVMKVFRDREKQVQKLARVADELQQEVYRIGPEKADTVSGHQLAQDCGRGSAQTWISDLQSALKVKEFKTLKETVTAIAAEMGEK